MSDDQWVSAHTAAARLKRTERQLRRYAQAGRVRSRLSGARVQYNAADVEQLATELHQDERPNVEVTEILAPSVLLDHIRSLETAIVTSKQREGNLETELARRPSPEEHQAIVTALTEERSDRKVLEHELTTARAQLGEAKTNQQRLWRALAALLIVIVVLAAALIVVTLLR